MLMATRLVNDVADPQLQGPHWVLGQRGGGEGEPGPCWGPGDARLRGSDRGRNRMVGPARIVGNMNHALFTVTVLF